MFGISPLNGVKKRFFDRKSGTDLPGASIMRGILSTLPRDWPRQGAHVGVGADRYSGRCSAVAVSRAARLHLDGESSQRWSRRFVNSWRLSKSDKQTVPPLKGRARGESEAMMDDQRRR